MLNSLFVVWLSLSPGWASLDTHGNATQLFRYSSLPSGFYADRLAFGISDHGTQASGYWRNLGEWDQGGYFELSPRGSGGLLRFEAGRSRYYADPTVLTAPVSEQTVRRFSAYVPVEMAGLRLAVTDRRVQEPDFVRLRPGPGLDYRALTYDAVLAQPVRRGDIRLGLRSSGIDDQTGVLPTGWRREFSASASQSVGAASAKLGFSDSRTDQTGLGSSSFRRWQLGARWALAPRLGWSMRGEIGRASFPFTQTRYAPNRDQVTTRLVWRPGRWRLEGGYGYRAWELYTPALSFVERSSANGVTVAARRGDLSLRYRLSQLHGLPLTLITELPNTTATLYYDRTQAFSASWSRPVGEQGSAYAGFNWTERRNSQRGFRLTAKSASVGVSVGPVSLDYLWDAWTANVSPFDPLGGNSGDDGDLNPGSPDRPLFSSAQTLTFGLNLTLGARTWASLTLSGSRNTGGARANTAYVGAEVRHEFTRDWSASVGYEREAFADEWVSLYNYNYSVVRITLTGRFGGR